MNVYDWDLWLFRYVVKLKCQEYVSSISFKLGYGKYD
jgi:hypothetical protein